MPPRLREEIARAAFGAVVCGIPLEELVALTAELREARVSLTNALHLVMARSAAVDVKAIGAAIRRINKILGGRL